VSGVDEFPPQAELLALPRMNSHSISDERARAHYLAYEKALTAVYSGMSVRDAARHHKVRRNTLNDIFVESLLFEGEQRVGYKACLKHHRRQRAPDAAPSSAVESTTPPTTLAGVLARVPAAQALADRFRGRLPERSRASRAFDTFFKRFMKLVKDAGLGELPLWASPDRGRRALIRKLQAARRTLPAPDLDEAAPQTEHGTRQEHLFPLAPFDRLEGDGHRIDVHWRALIQARDGSWVVRVITTLWLIVLIDVGARALVAWNLVIKDNYNRFDLLRTTARSLTPWRKRELIVPGLHYHPEAWMPTMVDSPAKIVRAACLALDSAMAHIARDTTTNLGKHFGGVVNLGFPGVPEGRPFVEAFFKKVEQMVFRLLAGGFRPDGAGGEGETDTTGLRPEDYPVKVQALEDLIDVVGSAYNVTDQADLSNQSPREVVERHVDTTLPSRSTLTATDVDELVVLRVRVKIAGKKKVRQPYVKWKGGTYRTTKMRGQYDLIGKSFEATLPFHDVRRMTLWREGKPIAVLHVISPWARTAHDYETRMRANACAKRGLVSWKGVDDAVAAYLAAVRKWAAELRWAADEFVRHDMATSAPPPKAHSGTSATTNSPLFDLPPLRLRR
jgi:hypothetical protein